MLITATRMRGSLPEGQGVGLTPPAGWGVTLPVGWGSLPQQDGVTPPVGWVGYSPTGMGLTTLAGWGSLPQQDGGSLSPSRMGGSLSQWDGAPSPSGMGLTPPEGWGAHSLPHMGMSLLSAFITTEDIVMVTGMASK